MKNYIVTVNGVSYEVSVEEVGEGQAAAPAAALRSARPNEHRSYPPAVSDWRKRIV